MLKRSDKSDLETFLTLQTRGYFIFVGVLKVLEGKCPVSPTVQILNISWPSGLDEVSGRALVNLMAKIVHLRHERAFRNIEFFIWIFIRDRVYKTMFNCTSKSLSEALIFASTNAQYDNRLFIELQIQYIKIPSSNLGRTCFAQKLFLTFRTIFVHNMFSPCSAKRTASDKDLPVIKIFCW